MCLSNVEGMLQQTAANRRKVENVQGEATHTKLLKHSRRSNFRSLPNSEVAVLRVSHLITNSIKSVLCPKRTNERCVRELPMEISLLADAFLKQKLL